jgi:UDP-N-acetylmuramyl pentapeptide synthase
MLPALLGYVRAGDTILVKASHFMQFPAVVQALQSL